MNPSRILAGGVVIALAMGAGFHLSQATPAMAPQPPDPHSPPMDVSSFNERMALTYLREGSAGHFNGSWLGEECWQEDHGERYVWSSSDFSRGVVERAQFDISGTDGSFYFDAQPNPGLPGVHFGPRWKLDGAAVSRFREILRQGEYFSKGSSNLSSVSLTDVSSGVCDADRVTLESCINGRYYGVVRKCESLIDDQGRARSRLNSMLQAFIANQTGGASEQLVAESQAQTRRRNGAQWPGP